MSTCNIISLILVLKRLTSLHSAIPPTVHRRSAAVLPTCHNTFNRKHRVMPSWQKLGIILKDKMSKNWRWNVFTKKWSPKGQLISKCLFSVFNSPKKGTKTIWLEVPYSVVNSNFFVPFLGEFKIPNIDFEINWPDYTFFPCFSVLHSYMHLMNFDITLRYYLLYYQAGKGAK